METNSRIKAHYGSTDLPDRLAKALVESGLDPDNLNWRSIIPLDQFHMGGFPATEALASELAVDANTSALDVGCGLGGPARYLAVTFGCSVMGLDLSPSFVEAARMLTKGCRLSGQVSFEEGDATDMPFEQHSFDLVWTQHASMNIPDKAKLYREVQRVLRPGGTFALHDYVGDQKSPEFHFPVPWARDPSTSFLVSEEEMRKMLEEAGFEPLLWEDVTVEGLAWLEEVQRRTPTSALSLATVMGPEFPATVVNVAENARRGVAQIVRGIFRR